MPRLECVIPRRRAPRTMPAIVAAIAIAATALVGSPHTTSPADAQDSPCRGGEGRCVPGGRFEKTLSFTVDGGGSNPGCNWVIDIVWGDGTDDQFSFTTTTTQTVTQVHTFRQPGIYQVATDGEGTPVGVGYACTFTDHTEVVEVPPRGSRLCEGQLATIVGTARRDRLTGTNRSDVIVGLAGNDVIDGRGGNDRICGDEGNDTVRGGDGDDFLHGGAGNDTTSGGGGTNIHFGGPGRDRLVGGGGLDAMSGDAGNDVLIGGASDDLLLGGEGSDRCRPGPGDNTVLGCER